MLGFQNITEVLVALLSLIFMLCYAKFLWRRRKMPPGPFPLPILGNFFKLRAGGLVTALIEMSKEYGPVYMVYMGSRPAVIVSGYQTFKEVLIDQGDGFLNRGTTPLFERLFLGKGLSFTNGDAWMQLRQFTIQTFKDLGMGKKCLEEPIRQEAYHLVEHFKSLNEQPFQATAVFTCAATNIIAKMAIGTRFDYNDKQWMKHLYESSVGYHAFSSSFGQLYDLFPSIMKRLPGIHNKGFALLKPLEDVLKERIQSHIGTLDPACPRDYIDYFLLKMKQEQKNHSKTPFTIGNLSGSIYDMFLGATVSGASTVNYGFLVLIKYPELQDKLHEEIDCVIGRTREPTAEDRYQMPYMNAVIHEVQRFCDIFPIGFVRATSTDVTFHGYFIPKDTNVFPLLTTALKDPKYFETPYEFNIKHFLDENGQFKKNNAFLAFSAGKRSCIVESIMRLQLFIFFTIVLQNFTLKAMVDPEDLDISPTDSGLENVPPDRKFIFIPRLLEGEA